MSCTKYFKEKNISFCVRPINLVLSSSNCDIRPLLIKRCVGHITTIRSRKKILSTVIYSGTETQVPRIYSPRLRIITDVLNVGVCSANIVYNRGTRHWSDQIRYRERRPPTWNLCSGVRGDPVAEMKENYISRKLIRQCQNVKESSSGY